MHMHERTHATPPPHTLTHKHSDEYSIVVFCKKPTINTAEFCRIHALARTPKSPEGRLYSGLIISKSERCRVVSGIPELAVLFLLAGKSRVHAY